VNQSDAPLPEGCDPILLISILVLQQCLDRSLRRDSLSAKARQNIHRTSLPHASAPWRKSAISNAPSRFCWAEIPGTGKSYLATGLAIAACRQRRRVGFTTAAALFNQLVEAQREQSLSRMLARWSRVELIVIDELGYVPLAEVVAELLFQVIAERAEKAAIIVTTNLPFSEWPQVFTNARLCKAVLDRLTDQAHIIETGSESYRFRRTLRKKTKE
jgi:hypothetical protein